MLAFFSLNNINIAGGPQFMMETLSKRSDCYLAKLNEGHRKTDNHKKELDFYLDLRIKKLRNR